MSELRIRIEPTDPQGSQAMSLLREAALEARRLYGRIDVGVPLRQFIARPRAGRIFHRLSRK